IEFDPERLEQIEERLELIAGLKRKYGDTLDDVLAYGKDAAAKLDALSHSEERGHELGEKIRSMSECLDRLNGQLTDKRNALAREFAEAVLSELCDLAMEKTQFEVRIEPCEAGPRGVDRVEFLIAPNPG